jgi:hypothetical protein
VPRVKTGYEALMSHPRGRVAQEERGKLPGWMLRVFYRMLIPPTVLAFKWSMRDWGTRDLEPPEGESGDT